MKGWVGAILAVALISCDVLSGGQKGPTTDLDRQIVGHLAPNADIVDQPFEDFLVQLDLPKTYGARASEILYQIRNTRAAVAEAHKTSSTSGGTRLASVASSVGTFSVPQFAVLFGQSLDELTKRGGTQQSSGNPQSKQESGKDFFTTTTLSATEIYTGSGAHVTGTLQWSYSTITIEIAGGATVEHITDERTLVGDIDVCPDTGGKVPASLRTTTKIVAQRASGTTTKTATGKSTFEGSVNEQAVLTSVAQRSHTEASSGSGGYTSDQAATWNANSSGDYIGNLAGSVTGSVVPNGAASAADAATAAGWGLALDSYALAPAYKAALDLWRHGRCVIVTAPDYGAETPIDTAEQNTSQHDQAVDVSSETKISVNLKHRFGGSVSAPVTAALTSGEKKLEPNRLDSAPSTVTYKAPDQDGKKATVQLKSTSKRGIGTLVLDFHTGEQALTLTITGTLKGTAGAFGTNEVITDTVTVGPLVFKKLFGDRWEATGSWHTQIHSVVSNSLGTQTCDGPEKGAITMSATTEVRAGKKVWVLDPHDVDADDGEGTLNCFTPPVTIRGVTIGGNTTTDSPGGSGGIFIGALETIVIPDEGGRVAVRGSSGTGGARWEATGTAEGVTKK